MKKLKSVMRFSLLLLLVLGLLVACGGTASPEPGAPDTGESAPEPTDEPAEEEAAEEEEPAEEPTEEPAVEEEEAPTEEAAVEEEDDGEMVTFTFAHPGPVYTMDAPVTWYGSTHWITNSIYDCLIWRNGDGSGYQGQAAERWEAMDEDTWRFYLREGLTFHNGEVLDAEAVKWNLDRVRTREDFLVHPQWQFITDVEVVDELTVDVTTDGPHAYLEYDISYNGCEILPPDYMEEVGEEEFARSPVGSGPYRLVEFTDSERYVLEAWDDYWGGRPEVDRIIYQVIPEVASQVAALLAGQVDFVPGIPAPDRERVEQAEGITLMQETGGRGHHLYLRTGSDFGAMQEMYPDYAVSTESKQIRQAISHALDRELLAEVQGAAIPALVRVPPDQPEGYAETYGTTEFIAEWYDPELARELIAEAGYDPDAGNRPVVNIDAPAFQSGSEKEVAEVIAVMLEEVGFEVNLNVLDAPAFQEQIMTPGNNREVVLITLGSSPSLVPLFYKCDWVQTYRQYCVEEWDAIGQQILDTVDPEERLALWDEWWQYYLDEADTVTLYQIQNVMGMNERFEWTPRTDGWFTFRELRVRE